MTTHVESHFDQPGQDFHEFVSDGVHVDLFHAGPGEVCLLHTVVTCGMSQHPMPAPDGETEHSFAELVLRLPPEWPLDEEQFRDERVWWPFGFETLRAGGREIALLGVIPLHKEEMEFKLEYGVEPLVDLLDDAEASELVEPARPSVIRKRRRLFGRG